MKITARELYELGIIERVIPEDDRHVRKRFRPLFLIWDQALSRFLEDWRDVDPEETALLPV